MIETSVLKRKTRVRSSNGLYGSGIRITKLSNGRYSTRVRNPESSSTYVAYDLIGDYANESSAKAAGRKYMRDKYGTDRPNWRKMGRANATKGDVLPVQTLGLNKPEPKPEPSPAKEAGLRSSIVASTKAVEALQRTVDAQNTKLDQILKILT